jgi:hypothetical protein
MIVQLQIVHIVKLNLVLQLENIIVGIVGKYSAMNVQIIQPQFHLVKNRNVYVKHATLN